MELSLIVSGRAGQGVQFLSETLGSAFVRSGLSVFCEADVESRIRGGHSFIRMRVTGQTVGASRAKSQLLVALDPAHVPLHQDDLEQYSVVLTDDEAEVKRDPGYQLVQIPLARTALEQGRSRVMLNTVAAGAVLGLLGHDPETLIAVVADRVGAAQQKGNELCIRAGFGLVQRRARKGTLARLPEPRTDTDLVLVSGAEALALGAIKGGVRFIAGYPMSPGTSILEYCAAHQQRFGLTVLQAEDEIAAANMAVGASFAGSLGLVPTAGGGMALMNEAISLAGMTETPLVIMSGMRPGPATGLATRTAQADLLSAVSCGHGEFPRAVICPGDADEARTAAARACRIAVRHQTPVIVLFDEFLADALWTVARGPAPAVPRDAYSASFTGPAYSYRRYEPTDDGVSPRLLPGTKDQLVYADSDEHTPEGHITESAEVRRQIVDKRAMKAKGIASELLPPTRHPDEDSETTVFSFGSTLGAAREAVDRLRHKGASITVVHLCDVWPFPASAVLAAAGRSKKLITLEGNHTGQLARLITQETGLRVAATARKYDGRAFTVEQAEAAIAELQQ